MSEQITTMDRAAVNTVSDALKIAMDMVAEEYGLTVEQGGGKFDPQTGTFTPKFTFAVEGADRRDFERSCRLVGLEPSDFGREWTQNGKTFRVTGVNLRAPRFPLQGEDVRTGRKMKFTEASINIIKNSRVAA